jgi:hypothetical protein
MSNADLREFLLEPKTSEQIEVRVRGESLFELEGA